VGTHPVPGKVDMVSPLRYTLLPYSSFIGRPFFLSVGNGWWHRHRRWGAGGHVPQN